MKSESTNLYKAMTPCELGAVAFHYCTKEGSERELERIAHAVPHRSYRGPDITFKTSLEAYTEFAVVWGLGHWQLRYRAMAAMGSMIALRCQKSEARALQQTINALWRTEAELLAMDAVLEDLCPDHGLDPADVRRITDTEPYQPVITSDKLIANPEYRETMRTRLSALLPIFDGGSRYGGAPKSAGGL